MNPENQLPVMEKLPEYNEIEPETTNVITEPYNFTITRVVQYEKSKNLSIYLTILTFFMDPILALISVYFLNKHENEPDPKKKKIYSQIITYNSMRRRRTQMTVQLRKNQREESLLKKRNIPLSNDSDEETLIEGNSLEQIKEMAQSSDFNIQLAAIQAVRKMLSSERNPPITKIIDIGMVPIFISCLTREDAPILQFEAAWALTNIASGSTEQTKCVVNQGAVPYFIRLLNSKHQNVCEQSVWALGNIIGEGAQFRDLVLEHGLMDPLLKLLKNDIAINFLRNLTWVFVNLCRHKDKPPSEEMVLQVLNPLYALINHPDINVSVDAIWAVAYLTDGGSHVVDLIIQKDFIQALISLLDRHEIRVKLATLRTIGNVVTGTDEQTQIVIDCGVFNYIDALLDSGRVKVIKETLWFLSNITAGNQDQVQNAVDSKCIEKVIQLLSHKDVAIKKEAAWVISNLAINGSKVNVEYIISLHIVPPLCELLNINDVELIRVVLDAIKAILKHEPVSIALLIEDCGGLDAIETLQHSNNEDIYMLVTSIIQQYFCYDEDGEQELT
ncbi:Importin subunit alpha-1 [Intoshia linei]|uniref:Importin subunit alpha n=1 Tax=Intoshia linei TaxID=1819745 RepID=A0A177B5X8_9BILA|nr:Importin subunit alpha-1 [Intoshia linei]